MMRWLTVLAALLPAALAIQNVPELGFGAHGSLAQQVNLWQLRKQAAERENHANLVVQDSAQATNYPSGLTDEFEERWFEQPVDHWSSDDATFRQRYWVNTRHYNATKGGPVFVLDGGETSGVNRLPFLNTGIMEILPKATGGIGIILEHRYYGEDDNFHDCEFDSEWSL